uniref:Fibrinogen C-terminal domain-containing protein n=1 Tax=Macrostomum lignano TaxID=282301 RepID=A0A1I8J334_9PLAT
MDVSSFARVGTTTFKGSKLGVFEIDGVRVAEPRVAFQSSCSAVKFSWVYKKYQLTLSIRIDPKLAPIAQRLVEESRPRVDHRAECEGGPRLVQPTVRAFRDGEGKKLGQECRPRLPVQLVPQVPASQKRAPTRRNIGRALQFEALGRVGSIPVRFGFRSSANLPRLRLQPAPLDRVPEAGRRQPLVRSELGLLCLDRLSEMTKTGEKNGYPLTSRCRLRIEVQSFRGRKYRAEFRMFQVLGPEQQYRLRVGLQVGRSVLGNGFQAHNEMRFSTFDRDHDTWKHSCSRKFGYGGWWFSRCHSLNLNGAYATDRKITNNPTYNSFYLHRKFVPMQRTLMKFKC